MHQQLLLADWRDSVTAAKQQQVAFTCENKNLK